MTVKLSIKVDSVRFRIYLRGDTNEIHPYLSPKYQEVHQVLTQEQARIQQHAKDELATLEKEASLQQDMLHLPEQDDEELHNAIQENRENQARLAKLVARKVTSFASPQYNLVWSKGKGDEYSCNNN